jgi:ParB-like chromosome segregation protein Spo0J
MEEVGSMIEKSVSEIEQLIANVISGSDLHQRVDFINKVRGVIHEHSPFKNEPIDFVKWVPVVVVSANDYNPNAVAPPEMELLRHSINHDGYTQPVVGFKHKGTDEYEVVDGFHRTRVCKECDDVNSRVNGYLPIVQIKEGCTERNDRMAATIRHNRARGKHSITAMSDIVVELKRRFWSDDRIAKELGMEADEVLRLQQIKGLAFAFQDNDFSESWEAEKFADIDKEEMELINED